MVRKSVLPFFFTLLLLIVGLYSTFYPTISSGFKLLQTDPGDTLFNAYILEHTFQSVFNKSYIATLWSPAFFYPYKNVLTYSVNLFGTAPFYWVFRSIVGWLAAYQLWMMLMFILMFISFNMLMKSIKVNPYVSALSAYLFTFNFTRVTQLGHQQLLGQFYTPLAILFLFKFYAKPSVKLLHLTLLFVYLQIIGDFYLGWFLILSIGIFIPVILYINNTLVIKWLLFIKSNIIRLTLTCIIWVVVSFLSLYPYIKFSSSPVAKRPISEVAKMLPTFYSWIQSPPGSLWYRDFSHQIPEYIGEHYLFIGGFSISLLLISLVLYCTKKQKKNNTLILSCLITSIILFILSFNFGNSISLWFQIYSIVPGAKAIRAVTRIEFIIYFYLILSAFMAFDVLYKNVKKNIGVKVLFIILFVLIITEQSMIKRYSFSPAMFNEDVSFVQRSINRCKVAYVTTDTKVFYRRINIQLVAMFAGLQSGVPVINGYSGFFPYPIIDRNLNEPELKKILGRSTFEYLCTVNIK